MCTCVPKKYELGKKIDWMSEWVSEWRQKGVLWYVHVCNQLNVQTIEAWTRTNIRGMNKNKNKLCCTTTPKSKSSISSLSFWYLPCLMINKELVNTHLSTFEHSNLTRNDKNNSTWPHLKTESLTLALIQHHGFFEKQWTCLVFNEALGPRNIKVNGGHFRRCVKLNSGSFL